MKACRLEEWKGERAEAEKSFNQIKQTKPWQKKQIMLKFGNREDRCL